ncbi:MAG: preprotein translocase subunit SecE [Phycisphaerales bacterium]|nr:preprotein translocase subunit SecE [Phycisphaerales bacterium]
MAFGLYKPGQGYWVRVMTAAVAAVVALAASAWLWRTLQVIEPPVSTWTVIVRPATGTAALGDLVTLLSAPTSSGPASPLGTGIVQVAAQQGEATTVTLADFKAVGSASATGAREVAPAVGSAATLAGPIVGAPVPTLAFDRMYIQASGVGVIIIAGTLLIYWLVGSNPGTSEFLIATDGEMKKVNWSTKKNIVDSTWVVIGYSVLLAVGLYAVDTAFATFFKLIKVLE